MLKVILAIILKCLNSTRMKKHTSRKVVNFRHLLGCDTIVSLENSEFKVSSVLEWWFIISIEVSSDHFARVSMEVISVTEMYSMSIYTC